MGQLGYRGTMVQYMTVPVYVVAAVFIIVIPFSSDIKKERPLHLAAAMAISTVAFAVLLGVTNPKVQYVFLCFGVGSVSFLLPLSCLLRPDANFCSLLPASQRNLRLRSPRARLDFKRHFLAFGEEGDRSSLRQRHG
jgi:hypothetical protein